jgi:hypothetical protein
MFFQVSLVDLVEIGSAQVNFAPASRTLQLRPEPLIGSYLYPRRAMPNTDHNKPEHQQ